MTYPIPSYRYKCYTLNLMVVIQVLYLKAYGCTQCREASQVLTKFFILMIIFTVHLEATWYSYSQSLVNNSLLLLQSNSYLLLHDCYCYHDYHCFQLLQLLLSYFLLFCFVNCYFFYFNFVYKYYIIFRIIKKPTFYHRTTFLLPLVSLLYYYSKSL